MMILIGLLTVVLVLDCLFLILLVLVQLPKKEAGMGQAFGGAATDALFGSGSGNALTKMTKYATIIFFALTLTISILFNVNTRHRSSGFERELQRTDRTPDLPVAAPRATTPAATTPANPAPGAAARAPGADAPAPAAPAATPNAGNAQNVAPANNVTAPAASPAPAATPGTK